MAAYRPILRYYRCDTPYRAILFQGGLQLPKMVRYPRLVLSFPQAYLCDTHFATYRAIIARPPPPIKTSTKEFCDTIATSIARYEKYRRRASKCPPPIFLYTNIEWTNLHLLHRSMSSQKLGSQFPLRECENPPAPENPGKLLKNYNLAHPKPVLKMTEKLLKKILKSVTF